MNTLEQVRRGLKLLNSVLNASFLDTATVRVIKESYAQVLRRVDESYLHLSIIGEFSAGKSTLINSMLGIPLLKTNLLACTGVPTYLYGTKASYIKITIQMLNGKSFALHGFPGDLEILEPERVIDFLKYIDKEFSIRWKYKDIFDTQTLIAALTSDNNIAQYLSAVKIEIPDYPLGEGIRLIDTPGVGAAGTEGDRHCSMTQDILKTKTDALLLVLDAQKVYSSGLEQFLMDNASGFMDHSIIVVNKADLIPEEERAEIRDYVHDLLLDRFDVDAHIYLISARNAKDQGIWQEAFQEAMAQMRSYLSESHDTLLQELALACMKEVMVTTKRSVQKRRQEIMKQREILEDNRPEQLARAIQDLQGKLNRAADDRYRMNRIRHAWHSAEMDCRRSVFMDLQEKGTRSEIKRYATGEEMKQRINGIFSVLATVMEEELLDMNDAFYRIFSDFLKKIQDRYQSILTSIPSEKGFHNQSAVFSANVDDILRQTYNGTDLESSENARILGGIGGMVAACFLLGPIGWLAGPAVAFAMNRYKLDEARMDVVTGMQKALAQKKQQVFLECENQLCNYSKARKRAYINTFQSSVETYCALFSHVEGHAQTLWKQYEQEITALEQFQLQMEQWESQCANSA